MTVIQNLAKKWLPLVLLGFLLGHSSAAFANDPAAWFVNGRPTTDALEAVRILKMAADDGLNPDDYSAGALEQALQKATLVPLPPAEQSALAAGLSRNFERFISDLHYGRVNPSTVHASFTTLSKQIDPETYVREAVARHALSAATRAAAPTLPLYDNLRKALVLYRQLENSTALQQPLPAHTSRKIVPGDTYVGIKELAQKLIALGDLPANTEIPMRYESALVEGVKAFQLRHGLAADGVIGRSTFEQLNTLMSARVRQIELTLERLRWTPFLLGKRMVVINLPEFVLRAYEVNDGKITVKTAMNIIVGKSLNTQTPLFYEDMRFIEFSPYWNVPPSIAKAETVPKLRRDPAYFHKQGMEFVSGDGSVVSNISEDSLAAVMSGKLRIRQRPGPKNALGDIKFIFPNNNNIYLHHTPSVSLFKRDRRDFSHGCIRVEEPVALAKFVLQDEPEWTEKRIREAMERGKSNTIRLKQPLPVVIAYVTVIVKRDGKVYFFRDIYSHDKLLDAALRKKR